MPDPIGGVRVSIGFSFGGGAGAGLALTGFSIAPTPRVRPGDGSWMVPEDGRNAAATLGLSVLGTMGAGMLIRSLKPDRNPAEARDLILDGLVGVQLGCGLIGHPMAESFYSGGVFSLPLQWIMHRDDPQWDYRVGMLSHGLLAVGRDALGGNPIPFQGYTWNEEGVATAHTGQLLGNAATDIGFDALTYGLGNSLATAMQGNTDRESLSRAMVIGGIYGGGLGLIENVAFGAPVRIDDQVMADALAMGGRPGAPDVTDVADHTTFRTGGLVLLGGMNGITLGRNVVMKPERLGNSTTVYHELIHRDQMAGSWSGSGPGVTRQGHGLISFYSQYLIDSGRYGYMDNRFEREPYHYANQINVPSMDGIGGNYGDLGGHLLNQLLILWPSTSMTRERPTEEPEPTPEPTPTGGSEPIGGGEPTG